jgi:3-hydroxyacyl-CoA dehydrogenase
MDPSPSALPMSPATALQNVDRLVAWKQQGGGVDCFDRPPQIRRIAVVGAGMMGTAIAAATVRHSLPVVITDADSAALGRAGQRIAAELDQVGDWSIFRPTNPAGASVPIEKGTCPLPRLVDPTSDETRIAGCDVILESITENLAAKQAIYARYEPRMHAEAIMASNTSTIPIARLAAGLAHPDRFCGIHFCHPVRLRPMVEIVRGPATSDRTIATAVAYARAIDRLPIVVDDGPGFLVNRVLLPYLNEALELLLEGATIEQIERAATAFGMAMGPLRLIDEIGLDTALLAGRVLWEAFPERIVASPLMITMYKAKRMGRKTGRGFFAYPDGLPPDAPGLADPAVEPLVAAWSRATQTFSDEAITQRLLLPMVLEASRILEEHKVRDPRDVDLAVLFGLGFPAARGGLLYWADGLDAARIVEMLAPLEALGPRMAPTQLLLDLARSGGRFYPGS